MTFVAKKKAKAKRTVKKAKPSTDGRNGKGQFTAGNNISTGASNHKAVNQSKKLKQALAASVSIKDIEAIVKGLLRKAKKGDVPAVKELFDRLWGKAPQALVGDDGGPIALRMIDFSGLLNDNTD